VIGKRYALEYTERLQNGFSNLSSQAFPMSAASAMQATWLDFLPRTNERDAVFLQSPFGGMMMGTGVCLGKLQEKDPLERLAAAPYP
jgi:hypothetical protein